MCYSVAVVFFALIGVCWSESNVAFPPWFLFGAASSAYQVEGGWNASDKGESMWDRLVHNHPEAVGDLTNGDIACDSYHQWQRDIEMVQELGLDMYRFSISWTRLLPTGFPNYISEDGKNYYNNLIDGLRLIGIEPVVTLYHFDLPQSLQDLGGWANPLITDWFADYARVVYSLYADRVKFWLTLNEPFGMCDVGYSRQQAPYLDDMKVGRYLCNKYAMIAHAKAWRIYDEEYKPKYHGKVSLSTLFIWYEPATPEDEELTQLTIEHWVGRTLCVPDLFKRRWVATSHREVLTCSWPKGRLPITKVTPFTPEEKDFVRGTYDFYGLNHYTTRLVRKARSGEQPGSWPFYGSSELGMVMENHLEWGTGAVDWFALNPGGLRCQLHWINKTYGVTDVMITENGYVDVDKGLEDLTRKEYIRTNLEQVLLAIQDGLKVFGYTVWTLMDNFEWMAGYRVNFGIR